MAKNPPANARGARDADWFSGSERSLGVYAKHYEDCTCIHNTPNFESPTNRNSIKALSIDSEKTILPKISRDFANFKNFRSSI